MPDTIYLAGDGANIIETAQSFTTSTADTNFGTEYLGDGDPGTLFKFLISGSDQNTDDNIIADLNLVENGDFESGFTSGIPDSWTDGSIGDATLSEETTIVNGGTSSLKFSTTSGTAIAYQDVKLVAGAGYSITAALRESSDGAFGLRLVNLDTGNALNSSEVWASGLPVWSSTTTDSWTVDGPSTFTMEAASVGGRAIYNVRIFAFISGTNLTAYLDDVAIWPHWDFAALFGAEYPPQAVTAKVFSDDNVAMSSSTEQVSFTFGRPGIFAEPASTVTERYAQLFFDGTVMEAISVGEWVLGTKRTLPNQVRIQWEAEMNTATLVSQDRGGRTVPVALERDSSRNFTLRCFANTDAQLVTLREQLFDAVKWGGGRLIIVPDDANSTIPDVYYGSLGPATERKNQTMWEIEAPFTGAGFAVRTK